jgi:hypothetical protein
MAQGEQAEKKDLRVMGQREFLQIISGKLRKTMDEEKLTAPTTGLLTLYASLRGWDKGRTEPEEETTSASGFQKSILKAEQEKKNA